MKNFEATAKSDRISAEARDICPACQQMVWMCFYIDTLLRDVH